MVGTKCIKMLLKRYDYGYLFFHFVLATHVTEVVLHHGGVARGRGFEGGGADTCCVNDTEATAQG